MQVDEAETEADTDEPEAEPVDDAAAHEHDHDDEPDDNEKALSGVIAFNEQLIDEQKALVDALAPLPTLVETLKELTSINDELAAVKAAVAEMQAEFKQRPRASRANETLADAEMVETATKESEEKLLFGRYAVSE